MGFDIKAALDGIVAFATQILSLHPRRLCHAPDVRQNNRIRDGIQKALTDNWQLTLLASTGIALSLASGYTTFDGLRNFTSAPLLSVFISFGIQGVMLIVAWLIGESFAVGMNQRTSDGQARAAGRRQRRHAARRRVRRPRLLLDAAASTNAVSLTSSGGLKADMGAVRRRRPSTSCWRWCWSPCWRSASGAAATSPRPTCRACA